MTKPRNSSRAKTNPQAPADSGPGVRRRHLLPKAAVDPETAQGQGRPAGDQDARLEQDPPREDGAGTSRQEHKAGVGAAHPAPSVRPYRINLVSNPNDALEFSEWLARHRDRGATLGIAVQGGIVGLASTDEGWVVPQWRDTVAHFVDGSLKLAFNSSSPLQFCCYRMSDLPDEGLAKIADEVETLSYCSGQTISGNYENPADEAYDALLICGHWRQGLQGKTLEFYQKVALPAAKHRATPPEPGSGVRWRITYEDLFLRVLAHQSSEPILVRAFLDERDPVTACAARLEMEDDEQAYAVLIWAAFGFDAVWLAQEYPEIHALLPDDLNATRGQIERGLPIIAFWVSRTLDDYTRQKGLRTRYGRVFRWGGHPSDALRFSLVGTAQDVLDVILVSLLDNPEGAHIGVVEGGPLDRIIRIKGSAGKANKRTWFPVLRYLAQAGNPLSSPLNPTVVWG